MQGKSSREYNDKNVKSEVYKVLWDEYEWAENTSHRETVVGKTNFEKLLQKILK
jgi:UDP-N-acetylglucosamine 2-epimerase